MGLSYMAIDKNNSVHEAQVELWKSHEIGNIRVDTMTEGIKRAMENKFVFIAINADNIENFMFRLPILRKVTEAAIVIGTSTFTVNEQIEALNNGADFYGKLGEPNENMRIALATINSINGRPQQKDAGSILAHGDFLIVAEHHQVFIQDDEIYLTKTEMEILHYLLLNHGLVVKHRQLQQQIWSEDVELSLDNLYNNMKRLRDKIRCVSSKEYIENIRDVGYRLT